MKPNLAAVLAAIQPGNTVLISLTPQQKRALADQEGQLALTVVRHLLGARTASAQTDHARDRFPLTEATFQAVARKLGHKVGIKRSRALIRRMNVSGVLERSGSYRQPYRTLGVSGYRVALFKLVAPVAPLRRKRPVGRDNRVKAKPRFRWWEHPLFGDASGRPPPGLTHARAARMRSLDEYTNAWQ